MNLEPLSKDARRLLEEERGQAPSPTTPEALARVWGRVGRTTAAAPVFGAAMGKLLAAVLGVVAGVGGTLVVQRWTAPAVILAPPGVPAAEVSAIAEPPAPVADLPRVPATRQPSPRAASSAKEAPRDASAPGVDQLAAEQALLDVGRAALVQRRGLAALEAVARHRLEHPRGQLIEERDALEVQALWQLGRTEEARAQTAVFRARFPGSIFLPALEILEAP